MNDTASTRPELSRSELLDRLADVAVEVGVNIQEGQDLLIAADVAMVPLVRRITERAYRRGAGLVTVLYDDEDAQLARFRFGHDGSFDRDRPWLHEGIARAMEDGRTARLKVIGADPNLLDGQDAGKVARAEAAFAKASKPVISRITRFETNWSIVAYATQAWAQTVFPGRADAVDRLWNAIFAASRVDGSVADPTEDAYDHAFVLLALATVYSLDRDAQVRSEIDSALSFVDTRLRSPHGGYAEGLPATLPRRQNPQMHLFEAMIAGFDATHEAAFQNRAGDFYALFVANLYDKQKRVLSEYFEEDWAKIEPVSVEPGHQAEWVWILKGFERITGCPTARPRGELMEAVMRSRDEATGYGLVETDADGNIQRFLERLWPQTELAKAWIAQAEGGEAGAADEARAALLRLEQHYLSHPVAGGWYDQFDRDGKSLVATIPASSFYHVLCAVTEAEQVLG